MALERSALDLRSPRSYAAHQPATRERCQLQDRPRGRFQMRDARPQYIVEAHGYRDVAALLANELIDEQRMSVGLSDHRGEIEIRALRFARNEKTGQRVRLVRRHW